MSSCFASSRLRTRTSAAPGIAAVGPAMVCPKDPVPPVIANRRPENVDVTSVSRLVKGEY